MKSSKTLMLVFFVLGKAGWNKLDAQPCPTNNPVVVSSTSNAAGQQNLQWAVGCVNSVSALTTITFNIAGAGPHIIQPGAATSIPEITKNNVWLNGSTDVIIIDGTNSGAAHAININASASRVEGLYIRNYTSGAAIRLRAGNNHVVSNNRLSGNQRGVYAESSAADFTASNNIIGLDDTGNALGNTNAGIYIEGSLTDAVIEDNTIAHNLAGVNILGIGDVRIVDNSFYCNTSAGIVHPSGPAAPSITTATPATITGTAAGNAFVQVFKHNTTGCATGVPCQGKTHIGNATANATGNWTLLPTSGALSAGERVTATATVGGINTSVFNTACLQINCSSFLVSATPIHISCLGQNTGAITLNISGGTAPFNISWSGTASGSATTSNTPYTISGLSAGNYTVVVTEANGCTATNNVTINQPSSALMVSGVVTNVRCFGESMGSINITASGAVGSFIYDWNDLAGANDPEDRSGLAAGVYSVTVSDAAGCMASNSFTITQPSSAINATSNITDVACFGNNTGAINLTTFGGTAPYSFAWADLPGANDPEDRTGLAAGNYSITTTDANLCTFINSYTVSSPATAPGINESITQVACFGDATGAIGITAGGGTPPYTYDWADLPGGSNPEDRTGLIAGDYTITVIDVNGCQITETYSVLQPAAALSASAVITPATCAGGASGAIALTTTGGTSPYIFDWADLPGNNNPEDRNNISAGLYTVTITDANSCIFTNNYIVSGPATAPGINESITQVACFGGATGAVGITAVGGTPPYTYDWADLPGGSNPEDRTGLIAGDYTITVIDVNGCQITESYNILQPAAALSASAVATPVTCAGGASGAIALTAAGGTSPYTFDWADLPGNNNPEDRSNLPAGMYAVTVTDVNNCPFSTNPLITQPQPIDFNVAVTSPPCMGGNTGSINLTVSGGTPPYTYNWADLPGSSDPEDRSALGAATYSVTVTDAANCPMSDIIALSSPGSMAVTFNQQNLSCFGGNNGAIDLMISGGQMPYNVDWADLPGENNPEDRSGLVAGDYNATISDANGCVFILDPGISINQPDSLTITLTPTDETGAGASDGTVNAVASGGAPPYTYAWSNSGSGDFIDNLAPGNYSVTVTDFNNCEVTGSATVQSFLCNNFGVEILSGEDIACFGDNTGAIMAEALNGAQPVEYLWNTGATTGSLGNLGAGVYHVLATDAAGCEARDTITLLQPPALLLQITTTAESAAGAADGIATAMPGGGTMPYTFAWTVIGQTSPTLTGLSAGVYTCTLTDANFCTVVASGTVELNNAGGPCQAAPAYALYAPEEVCGNTPFTLRADDLYPGPGISYVWLLPNGDTLYTTAPELELTATSTDFAGQYFVLRDSMGCLSAPVGGAPISILSLDPGQAMAGADTVLCSLTPISLSAALPPQGLGRWQSLGEATVNDPLNPGSSISNLQPGANIFLWKVSIGDCPQAAIDTLEIFFEAPPALQDDRYRIERVDDIAVMNVLLNDRLEGLKDTTVTIASGPSPDIGQLEWLPDTRQFRYRADENARGLVQFQYQVCSESAVCGPACATATVTIEILNLPVVPEGIIYQSGNDNERLFIKGINGFTRIEMTITDRWGDVVFYEKNYSNESPWKGENQRSGAPLPQGTYYYILKAFDGENLVGKPQTGAIHLFVR